MSNKSSKFQVQSSKFQNFSSWFFVFSVTDILIPAILIFSGCVPHATPERLGQAHFLTFNCNRCHRVGYSGGIDAPDLTMVGFRHSREWLDLWLKNPSAWKKDSTMQNFHLQDKTRGELTAYLASLKGQDFDKRGRPWNDPSLAQSPVKRGQILYEKAGCAACHGKNGRGGYPNNNVPGEKIPPLKYVSDGYSKQEMTDRIKKGRKPDRANSQGPEPMIEMPAWGEVLSDDEILLVVEYLFSIRPNTQSSESW